MKPTKSFSLILLALIGILIYSCQNDKESFQEQIPDLTLSEVLAKDSLPEIKLGEKLQNPYSVTNMKIAYESLKKKQVLALATSSPSLSTFSIEEDIQIETTDYYIKFWIETDEQKNMLIADSLNLSDIPLDVEVLEEGIQFIDEDEVKEESHWVYTAVPKEYTFRPEITYEILEDLFLIEPSTVEGQEEDEPESQEGIVQLATNAIIKNNFLLDLEEEALRITGNLEDVEDNKSTSSDGKTTFFWKRKRKKTPRGYVNVYNTVTRELEPVVGIKVKTRRWFKWAKGWTNSQGFYKVNRGYRNKVRYTAVFKNRKGFKIWPSILSISSARYRAGRHSKSGHDFNFYTNSVGWRWATVNNAALKYLDYCTQFGIGKPHSNLRIVANSNGFSGGSGAPMLRRTWGWAGFRTNSDLISFLGKISISVPANALWIVIRLVLPDVIIKANASQGTDGVYENTFHELGHASHFKKVGSRYWIKYINYIITYGAYGDGHGYNAGHVGVGEMWGYYIGARLAEEEFGITRFYRPDPVDGWIPAIANRRVVNEADYTVQDIFSSLNSNINTIPRLNTEYNSRVGKNIPTVNQIFDDYGY